MVSFNLILNHLNIFYRSSSFASVLLRLITLQSLENEDKDIENDIAVLSGVMSEMNVGESLPERPLSYEQVRFVINQKWVEKLKILDIFTGISLPMGSKH